MEIFMAKKKRQGPATESQESNVRAPLPCLAKERTINTLTSDERLDNKDEQAELLVTSADAGEGEN